jgi:GTPase SAR1 family protein
MVIIVFSIAKRSTFEELDEFINQARQTSDNSSIILVGNKTDLAEQREISMDEAKMFADSRDLPYMEISSKDHFGAEAIFSTIVELACNRHFN